MKTMQDYSIVYNNIRVFNSDNVSYTKKAFCDTLSCLFPFCIHITCHSHIVNLVASDFKKAFKEATEFVKCFCNLLYVPSGRKSCFMKFLQEALNPGESATMPPNPTLKARVPGLILCFIMQITSSSSQISSKKRLTVRSEK